MGWGAGKKLQQVLANTALVVAIELLCAAEGCEQRAPLQQAAGTAAVLDAVRERVPALDGDRSFGADIERAAEMITTGGLDSVVNPSSEE